MVSNENLPLSPEIAWNNLSPEFAYLKQFKGINKYLKLVESNGEYVPSPDFSIHQVSLTYIKDQPTNTGFSISQSEQNDRSTIIVMDHESRQGQLGFSGCYYHKGRMLNKEGLDIAMFSKMNNPGSRNPKVVSEEIEAYRLLERYNDGKPSYIAPYFVPNNDELVMVDLYNLGFDDNKWSGDISTYTRPVQRQLFVKIFKAYSQLNHTFLKARYIPKDIILHGKGIWANINNPDDVQILLSDIANIQAISETSDNPGIDSIMAFMDNLTKGSDMTDDNDSFLEIFPFISVDKRSHTISTSDPVIASIHSPTDTLITLLTNLYQQNYEGYINNPTNAILDLLWRNGPPDYDSPFDQESMSLGLLLRDIAVNPESVFSKKYLLGLESRTNLTMEMLIAALQNLHNPEKS